MSDRDQTDVTSASGTQQTHLPDKRGYANINSETWHYLRRCAGDFGGHKMQLPEAVSEGYDLCGVCCSRFAWYDDTGK